MHSLTRLGRSVLLAGLTIGLMASSAYAQQLMQGRIWDFSSSHPDFESGRGGVVMPGQVQQELDADGKPVWAGPSNKVFSSKENFDQWYRDVPGVNMSKPYALELVETPAGSGSYAIERYNFFPIDNELLGNEDGQFLDTSDQPRNFHYTMQLAGEFSFQNDTDHFTFTGDDDLWVFFGGRLGIDLGGTHRAETATITGAQLRELGLNPGESYPIDVFFAERQSRGSNFVIQTNFNIQPPVAERVPVGDAATLTMPLQPGTELVRGQRYYSPSGDHFLVLNPDGNLVVARANGDYVWGFDTQGVDFPRVGTVIFQEDGNLAAYAEDGSYIWSALTENPDPTAQLVLQPNGALQLAAADRVLWTSIPYEPAAERVSADVIPQTNTGRVELAWNQEGEEALAGTPVAFVSTDGTAAVGSRSVFIVRDEATGQSTLVPVMGDDERTRTVVDLAPGTYSVLPPAPSIGQFSTFTTTNISASQIVVPEPTESLEPAVTVSFSIDTQVVQVAMLVDEVTATSVGLSWGSLPEVAVAEYVLVRTDGTVPADNPGAGTPVPLASPTAQTAVAEGLETGREYTFTLFSTSTAGKALPVRTYTATTAVEGSLEAAYAVAPNTILPTDFAALNAQRIGEHWVRVQLDPAHVERGSNSEMAGIEDAATLGGGCVVGTPFLVTTDVAGENSFYGAIDVCEASENGVSTAIVNTDVPLSTVFSYFSTSSTTEDICYDPTTGERLEPNSPGCLGIVDPMEKGAFEVTEEAELLPSTGSTGEVQVTLLWTSGDDLDLHVTEPNGTTVNWMAPTAANGGQLELDHRGSDCGVMGSRVENTFWDQNAPRGTYLVQVLNHKACTTPAEARVQVRVGGKLVIDQVYRVGEDGPISFDVQDSNLQGALQPAHRGTMSRDGMLSAIEDRALAAWTQPVDLGHSPQSPLALPPRLLVAQNASSNLNRVMTQYSEINDKRKVEYTPMPNVKCTGTLDGRVGLNPVFRPKFTHDVEVKAVWMTWNVDAGIEAGVSPTIWFSGEAECALDVDGYSFQLLIKPIPINLEVKPDISVNATGKVSINGPALTVTMGVKSEGKIEAKSEWCKKWGFPYPCVNVYFNHKTKPINDFEVGKATATIAGSLGVGIGAQVNIGIGMKNALATAKGGFSFRMFPIAAELKAVAGTSNCVAGAIGGRLAVDVLAEAYVLGLGDEYRRNLYDTDVIAYPGAKFEVGKCPDD